MNSIFRSPPRAERRLYLGATALFLALVFWTFARTTTLYAAAREVRGHTDFAAGQVVITSLDLLRRLHPAFAWGACLFIAAFYLALHFTQTRGWIAFGESILS